MFVLDTSVTMAWCFRDEATPFTKMVFGLLAADGLIVPGIWPYEVGNTLLMGERRGRLTEADSASFIQAILSFPIAVDDQPMAATMPRVVTLGRQLGLTAYDASYLDLAIRRRLPLATQDARLRDAAARVGVDLIQATDD